MMIYEIDIVLLDTGLEWAGIIVLNDNEVFHKYINDRFGTCNFDVYGKKQVNLCNTYVKDLSVLDLLKILRSELNDSKENIGK